MTTVVDAYATKVAANSASQIALAIDNLELRSGPRDNNTTHANKDIGQEIADRTPSSILSDTLCLSVCLSLRLSLLVAVCLSLCLSLPSLCLSLFLEYLLHSPFLAASPSRTAHFSRSKK